MKRALAVVVLLLGCDSVPRPNLLLVVVDTLRADALGVHGAETGASPRLDRLADEAIVFERAYATAPWTMPSIASILTGQQPRRHGVMGGPRVLPPAAEPLAERLARVGYRTGAVTSHVLVAPHYGFHQGFEIFHVRAGSHRSVTGEGVTRTALATIDALREGDAPFFALVHYFDPHYAYLDHRSVTPTRRGVGRVRSGTAYRELLAIRDTLTPDEIAHLRDLYAEEVRYTDGQIGRLLDGLEERGLERDTWVVVTADHGEELMERGWIGHTTSLRETLLRVPLLMRPPTRASPGAPARIPQPVSLAGLTPTLLELLGVRAPGSGFDARSFAAWLADGGPAEDGAAPILAEVDYRQHAEMRTWQQMVIRQPYKLVHDHLSGRTMLYDLRKDPGEARDLSAARPQEVRRLAALLAEVSRTPTTEPAEIPLDAEQRRQLRELGYVQ